MRNSFLLKFVIIALLFCAGCEANEEAPLRWLNFESPIPFKGMRGDTISILGNDFDFVPQDINITIGNIQATVISVSATEIKVKVPEEAAPTCSEITIASKGYYSQTTQFCVKEYPVPAIANITPQSGSVGSLITIHGKNFGATVAQNKVQFIAMFSERLPANPFEVTSAVPVSANSNTIEVKIPAGTVVGSDEKIRVSVLVTPNLSRPDYKDSATSDDFMITP